VGQGARCPPFSPAGVPLKHASPPAGFLLEDAAAGFPAPAGLGSAALKAFEKRQDPALNPNACMTCKVDRPLRSKHCQACAGAGGEGDGRAAILHNRIHTKQHACGVGVGVGVSVGTSWVFSRTRVSDGVCFACRFGKRE